MLRRFVSGVGAAIGRTEATATASAAHSKSGRTGPSTSPGSSQTRMCAPPGLADLRPRPSPADGRAPQQLPSDSTAVPRTQAIQRNRADLSSWFAALSTTRPSPPSTRSWGTLRASASSRTPSSTVTSKRWRQPHPSGCASGPTAPPGRGATWSISRSAAPRTSPGSRPSAPACKSSPTRA